MLLKFLQNFVDTPQTHYVVSNKYILFRSKKQHKIIWVMVKNGKI